MRVTRATIFLGNLRHNVEMIRRHAPEQKILAAVKADAYGHGSPQVAQTLQQEGVEYLGVATLEEASELRREKITLPILLLGIPHPEEIPEAAGLNLAFVVSDAEHLGWIGEATRGQRMKVPLHLKIDVGMGRLGIVPESAISLARSIGKYPQLYWEGVMTHFPSSDNGEVQPTSEQNKIFTQVIADLKAAGYEFELIHAANSGAILDHPETHHTMVRPGILLYGYTPTFEHRERRNFYPVMQLESRVVLLKSLPRNATLSYGQTYVLEHDAVVGVVGCGYADGYSRGLSNRGRVRIGDKFFQVSGRVCMDLFMVDIGNASDVSRWEKVILFGPFQDGPDAWDLAQILDTIPYEITCAVSRRVPRVYAEETQYWR